MQTRSIEHTPIHECDNCRGVFLTHATIERILEDRAGHSLANALVATLPRARTSVLPPPGQRMYVTCPSCHTLMNRKLFATGAGVVIDVCRADGAFFDEGELPAVVNFVMAGGLEKAARKDTSQVLEQRRAKLPTRERAAAAGFAGVDAGAALADLLFSLFS
jgi:Zn-finger nucleic acid-binding protein